MEQEIYRFEEFELDPARRSLARNGNQITLSPKAFEVLTYLVMNSGRVVTKDELLKAVWPQSFVEENNLTQHISSLRKALAEKANYIVTIPGRGYHFTAAVQEKEQLNGNANAQDDGVLVQRVTEPPAMSSNKLPPLRLILWMLPKSPQKVAWIRWAHIYG